MILNAVLGRGMSSRLFKEVRERRGLAYSVGSSVSRHSDTGMLGISAGVSPENLREAVTVILDELEKLTQEPVGEDELTKARDYTIGSFRLSLESSMALGPARRREPADDGRNRADRRGRREAARGDGG